MPVSLGLPDVVFLLSWFVLPVVLCVIAHRRLRRSGSGAIGVLQMSAVILGLGILTVALLPSISEVTERSFAGHMTQHLAIGLVAPLLLIVGRTNELVGWLLGAPQRQALARSLRPLAAPRGVIVPTVVMIVVWFSWHVPALYGVAVDVAAVHVFEHLTMIGSALWFWAAVAPQRRQTGAAVFALFSVTLCVGLLGAVLSLSPSAFYFGHVEAIERAAALDDQHLGGLLMWTPGGLVYLVAMATQLIRWLDRDAHSNIPPMLPSTVEVTT